MFQLYHIIKYKIIANSRLSIRLNFVDLFKEFGSIIVYAGFALGAFFFSKISLYILLEKLRIGYFLLHEFISIIFFIFFISINVGNIVVSWSTLYKSAEINYFFTKPIPAYRLFLIKFIDNIFYSSSTLLLVLLSVFFGYIYYFELTIVDLIIILFLNLLPFIITAASLGVIILLIIVKLATIVGARNLIIAIALIYVSSLVVFFKSLSPLSLVYTVLEYYPNVDQYFGQLLPSIIHYTPNQWFAETLYWMLRDDFTNVLVNTTKQVSIALVFLIAAISLGKAWYYNTWLQDIKLTLRGQNKKKKRRNYSSIFLSNAQGYSSIIIKDAIMFFRDSTQVVHSLVLLLLVFIFMASASGISYLRFEDTNLAGAIYLSIFMFVILLISTLALRFIFPLISLEGYSFWKIRTSPLEYFNLINIKLLPPAIPIIILSVFLVFFSHIKLAPHLTFFAIPAIVSIGLFLIMLNYSMGIIFVRYNEKNAIRIASSKGASLTFLFSVLYMLIVLVILFPPVQEHFSIALNSNYYSYKYIRQAYYIVTVFSLAGAFVFYRIAHHSIRTDF